MEDREAHERIARIEVLVGEIEGLADPRARSVALDTVQALLELYGEGLRRIVAAVADAEALAGDELVAHLLLLHDLHPVDLETRVVRALDEVRPYLHSHGGGVELLGIEDGVARLRLEGSCDGCPSSAVTMRLAIEEALQRAAPELERIDAEGLAEPPRPALVQIGSLRRDPGPGWAVVALPELGGGLVHGEEVAGERIVFLSLDSTLYAYRDHCPSCDATLEEAALADGELLCCSCLGRYDVRRAGRSIEQPDLSLEPVPLLVEGGVVRVAVPEGAGR